MTWLQNFKANWPGEVTTLASLLFDTLANMVAMEGIISSGCAGYEGCNVQASVTSKLYIGSLAGVILGNLAIWCYQVKWDVGLNTAIPFGVDAPTVFFMAITVRTLFANGLKAGVEPEAALKSAWGSGASVVLIIGGVKLALTTIYVFVDFPGRIDSKMLAGCLAGIGLTLLAMTNLVGDGGIFTEPFTGLVCMFVFLMVTLPREEILGWRHKVPHFLWSVLFGVPIYYVLASYPDTFQSGAIMPKFFHVYPSFAFVGHFGSEDIGKYAAEAISFAVLIFCCGYAVVKVALEEEMLGDNTGSIPSTPVNRLSVESDLLPPILHSGYTKISEPASQSLKEQHGRTIRTILFIDALSTIFGGLLGGVIQTTPYIGHSAFRKLGAKKDYAWMFAVTLLVLALTGTMGYIGQFLPAQVIKPVFILVGCQIMTFAFGFARAPNPAAYFNQYIPALTMGILPCIAQLLKITIGSAGGKIPGTIVVLSSGFAILAILWGQVTLSLILGERAKACKTFIVLGLLTFIGFIHSFDGVVTVEIWKHGDHSDPQHPQHLALYTCLGYFFLAGLSLIFVPNPPKELRINNYDPLV